MHQSLFRIRSARLPYYTRNIGARQADSPDRKAHVDGAPILGRWRVICLVSIPARQAPTLRLSAARTVMPFLHRIVLVCQGLGAGDA
jgi:hypothetical protein